MPNTRVAPLSVVVGEVAPCVEDPVGVVTAVDKVVEAVSDESVAVAVAVPVEVEDEEAVLVLEELAVELDDSVSSSDALMSVSHEGMVVPGHLVMHS